MIDTLIPSRPIIDSSDIIQKLKSHFLIPASSFQLPNNTLQPDFHRPSNVDNPDNLKEA